MKTFCHLTLTFFFAASCVSADDSMTGMKVKNFTLPDHLGAQHSLDDWADQKAVVIVFLGTECPLAKLYAKRLVDLSNRYQKDSVQIVGINSNRQDTLQEITHYVRTHGVNFPMLKDAGSRVAESMGADRTPEAFLIDGQRIVRYRGRIDDQYGVGYSRGTFTRQNLAEAIDEVLAGEAISSPYVEAVGCHIGQASPREPTGDITYCNQIARLMQKHCVRCHRDGQIAPFSLTSADDVAAWSETICEVLESQRMPPWHANPLHGEFRNNARMSDSEKDQFYQWVDNGTPIGEQANLPDPLVFPARWQIGEPELVLKMPEAFTVPAKGTVPYQYFYLDTSFEEDVWIKASEVRPGNRSVVHHIFLFYLPPGQERANPEDPLYNTLASFAPGVPAGDFQDGLARFVPAGSRLGFQVHYTPNGSEQIDQSEVGLIFAKPEDVKQEIKMQAAINLDFVIQPGAVNQVVNSGYQFTQETLVHALSPHMHYRGRSFRFTAMYPDGSNEILLDVPNYDFNWQNTYVLREPKLMPDGTVMMCRGVFDNSVDNLVNPDPTATVRWGDQTWEEMMLGSFVTSLGPNVRRGEFPKVTPLNGKKFTVAFQYQGDDKTRMVSVAGSFNDWNKDRHKMDGPDANGNFTASIKMNAGQYQYKFVVNGEQWILDPQNPNREGPFSNTVVRVRKAAE